MPANGEQSILEELHRLVEEEKWDELHRRLSRIDPADVADFLEELDPEDRDRIFEKLDVETASDVLSELESPAFDDVVEDLPSERLADLAESMPPDDAAEMLSELEDEHSAKVLAAMDPEERAEVAELLQYPEHSAGRIMTPEICAVPPERKVREVLDLIRRMEVSDPIFNVYVIDPEDRTLLGVVTLSDLMRADPEQTVGQIAEREYQYAEADEDQEDVARRLHKYHLYSMPVLDRRHRLLGRITADDALDVVQEEVDEDFARLVGAPDIEEEEQSPLRVARLRLPWLLVTMCTELVIGVIVKNLLNVTNVVAIAIFVPAILAMGGNTGQQSSTITVRGIALGKKAYRRLLGIVWREVRVGLCLGATCGLLSGLLVWAILTVTGADTGGYSPVRLGVAVGVAMCNAMLFGSAYGSMVPVIVHRLGIDPALASGPFVSTSNDLSAALIYFGTCVLFLGTGGVG